MSNYYLYNFVAESNLIEGIDAVSPADMDAHKELLSLKEISMSDLEAFVLHIAGAKIRSMRDMNVKVGNDIPPPGGPIVVAALETLIQDVNANAVTPLLAHVRFEKIHPFMDGNGRCGRALWAWQMIQNQKDPFSASFLKRFYYQTIAESNVAGSVNPRAVNAG